MNLIRIHRKWMKLRLRPIRVFCLHHITKSYDVNSMCNGDWMNVDSFKQTIRHMQQQGYRFISLDEAYHKVQHDFIRCHRYAVLTADDGYKSLDEVLPWLIENKLPITLFINGKYTDGISCREVKGKRFSYLTTNDLQKYVHASDGLISIQSHGWEHLEAAKMTADEFTKQIENNNTYIKQNKLSKDVRFHAYTWGKHNGVTDRVLAEHNVISVLIDGMKNYNDKSLIHRELLDEYEQ